MPGTPTELLSVSIVGITGTTVNPGYHDFCPGDDDMTDTETDPAMQLERGDRGYRYFRNAVERHWDPYEIDLEQDRENILENYERYEDIGAEIAIAPLAMFGAGEEAVTEDLAPLAQVLEDIEDQMFITTQLYEEAKHTDFFDRYWREVVHPTREEVGEPRVYPNEDRWYADGYLELFDRTEEAMHRLLEEDTPENRVKAYTHYHLTVEGILAQTGYWGLTKFFDGSQEELAPLPGLVEGIKDIRSDEGRHVGFGMAKVKEHVESGDVEFAVVQETIGELLPLVQETVTHMFDLVDADYDEIPGEIGPGDLAEYAITKHQDRMGQIGDADASVPDVDELTALGD